MLGEGGRRTEDLLDRLDASRSAVYNALGELEEHGLVREDDRWELTGSGRLLADIVAQRRRYERVLTDLEGYLRTHDTAGLPRELRRRVDALAGAEVFSATETEPNRAVAVVSERLDAADWAKMISPVYVGSYETAIPDTPGSKLVVDERLVRSAAASDADEASTYEELTIRVAGVDFALGVTDSELLLSLPKLDGGYDSRTEVIADHDCARRWGEDLFEQVWESAVPIDEFQPESPP